MFFFLFSLSFLTLFHSGFSATAEEGTSKKRVVILAGMIKTGSSAAQRMFHFNAQNLKKQGVFYPHIWSIYQEFMKWTKKPYMTF
ncbi:MAG: hypothetical protein H6925_02350 [Holosporaceae bacterium]|nr:MAG: hypothetical protein H6925_02350 [Holosporaceae bacterium]